MAKATEQHYQYAANFAAGMNATKAAIEAGFSARTADKKSFKWVGNSRENSQYPELWDFVHDIREKAQTSAVAELQEVLEIATAILRTNVSDIISFDGKTVTLVPFKEIPPHSLRAIRRFKFKGKEIAEVELYSKLDAVEKLMRYYGAFQKDNQQQDQMELPTVDYSKLSVEELETLLELEKKAKINNN